MGKREFGRRGILSGTPRRLVCVTEASSEDRTGEAAGTAGRGKRIVHCAERHGRGRCAREEATIHLCGPFATPLNT